jgi:hypothetical protein
MAKKDVVFSEAVYWALVDLKDEGRYRSIDEALRPVLGLPSGERPFLKGSGGNGSCAG